MQSGPSTSIQTDNSPQTIAKLQLQNVSGTPSTNVQKILTSGGQIIATPTNTSQKIITTSNLQQLLSQQKIVVSPSVSQVQKVLVAAPNVQETQKVQIVRGSDAQPQPQQSQQQTTFHASVGKQIIIQQSPGQQIQQPQQQQQHLIIKQGNTGQKIIQQIVSPQQLIVGGQRIILSPSQRLVQSQPQAQVQQIFQQQPQQVIVRQQPQILQQPIQTQTNQQQATQIVVQNQNLAHQIATGKVQMTTINGQQVFVRQGNGNLEIVATIKHQTNGPAQVVPTQEIGLASNNSAGSPINGQQQQIHQQVLQQKSVQTRSPQQIQSPVPPLQSQSLAIDSTNQISPSIEQSLLQGQPPGTVIKCVTAQVIQTQNGPRIVLQGLQGSEFTQQQSALVQQQVKQQLLKG
jgi:nucleosome-remodeling factor subunit BPTF